MSVAKIVNISDKKWDYIDSNNLVLRHLIYSQAPIPLGSNPIVRPEGYDPPTFWL